MASSLALRFRSHLLRTASLLPSSLRRPPFQPSSPLLSAQRLLSTARRSAPRSRKSVDIGARARQLQTRRLWAYALTFSGLAGFVVIVLNNFQDQLVFYITPTDALEKYATNPSKARFRLGGLVLEGSVVYPKSKPEVEFVITDLITDIVVRYEGSLPDLFREGHSVVAEGIVKPFTEEIKKEVSTNNVSEKARRLECYFSAVEVLAKHDEKYMPKEVAAAIEKNKKIIEEAAAVSVAAEVPKTT
ncbi:uncharacterized protein LOC106755670 [Vigna radiata var. radiata]|uniref:Uncharacterized protein LOC106755670 n=1 Tax=Vigna radiata var. radiata TaxID=3916 RepID=A0A3Q0ESQ3_VIGRR|nr:uncharacterized protein LOC106755670 [Vigna radiata var. radiata]XP_022634125.1 uncharacterized protein LOC106755670 [Vigna radiata var. radiata]XP_022634126.1 uncharacterized protein LOC106755670 [Vigna radiata var. radiata]XP_022634127.1 uncharacterized protein LOC106755670 [Vigna radiata var. radiata]XP_022634128.1 uncharacterized protein LOC106755670 [Vigna radiata var. radiata]XP_022634129.1 uncharacterized protein LOC106755670 [Vigna radiata var. radiata]XP_022634130.1 uncharacterize